jgi:glycosyltransferase involved in cell wall biosynthesis
MRVLLVSQYFFPEVGATQTRMREFAQALTEAGHEVDVLTEFPNHPSGVIPQNYRGRWIEIDETLPFRVVRVWVYATPVKTFWTRLFFYGTFLAMAVVMSVRLPRRYDVVAATSPPLPVALAGLVISRLKRAAFVMDVRDLWPLAAGALKELSNPRLYRWAERIEQYLYRKADRITVTTRAFEAHVLAQDPARRPKLAHVPNGTIVEVFDRARGDGGVRQRLGLDDSFVVSYAGLHGVAQGLSTVLAAAERLAGVPRVRFVFLGEGPLKASLKGEASARGLSNVLFIDQVPLDDSAQYLNASDAVVVPLIPDPVFRMFVPSKLFDAMACGKPVLLLVDGEARTILDEAGAGLYVEPGNDAALADAVLTLAASPQMGEAMGTRGRGYVRAHYDRRTQSRQFARIVEDAAGLAPHPTAVYEAAPPVRDDV